MAPTRHRRVSFVVLALALAVGCHDAHAPGDDERELIEREAAFAEAVASGDHARFEAFWAEDAHYVPDGPIVEGRSAILEEWKGILDDPGLNLTWEPVHAEVASRSDLGYTFGTWSMTQDDETGTQLLRRGRYLTVWRRDDAGVWLVVVDIGNADEPPDEELSF